MTTPNPGLKQGAVLMVIAALAFIGYAVVFFIRNFTSTGFELGVDTLNGVTRDQLNALNPAIVHYIGHLHVATAGFIAGTGIAVAALSWYGVARGEMWAWVASVVAAVVALAVALPYHYTGTFQLNWVTHLGPIYPPQPSSRRNQRGRRQSAPLVSSLTMKDFDRSVRGGAVTASLQNEIALWRALQDRREPASPSATS